jgi:hypothetical protein
MINYLSVSNSPAANSADFQVTPKGKLNITGLPQIVAGSITNIEVIPASAEQIQKATLTFTAANSTQYEFLIQGYAMSNGAAITKLVTFMSDSSATLDEISAAATLAVNSLTDFNVSATATSDNTGRVFLVAKTATAACPNAPIFNVFESSALIAITAVATATAAAAPTGGETAVLEPVINASGVMTGIRIISGGAGYLAAPSITIANGGGAGSAVPQATCTIFEGEVVAIQFTAGTSYTYTAYKGFQVVGTGAALKNKYGFIANANLRAVPSAFAALSSFVDATNYTEVIVSYDSVQPSGTTQFATTVDTAQVSFCVAESATNASDIIARGYGSVANLIKGYRCQFQIATANGTDQLSGTAVASTAILTVAGAVNGIKGGDIILVGTTPQYRNIATAGIFKVTSQITIDTYMIQIGGNNLNTNITSSVMRVVARESILG